MNRKENWETRSFHYDIWKIDANEGIRKRKIPATLHKKPSVVSPIEIPHPGTSYNPSYDDHQKLLHEVADEEQKLMKEEAHLNRVTTKMFKKVNEKANKNLFVL